MLVPEDFIVFFSIMNYSFLPRAVTILGAHARKYGNVYNSMVIFLLQEAKAG